MNFALHCAQMHLCLRTRTSPAIFSVHERSLAEDLSTLPSVLRLDEAIGRPVVVVFEAVAEGGNARLSANVVREEGRAAEADPLKPVEVALDEVGAHAGR